MRAQLDRTPGRREAPVLSSLDEISEVMRPMRPLERISDASDRAFDATEPAWPDRGDRAKRWQLVVGAMAVAASAAMFVLAHGADSASAAVSAAARDEATPVVVPSRMPAARMPMPAATMPAPGASPSPSPGPRPSATPEPVAPGQLAKRAVPPRHPAAPQHAATPLGINLGSLYAASDRGRHAPLRQGLAPAAPAAARRHAPPENPDGLIEAYK
jgi:hypothetical protein